MKQKKFSLFKNFAHSIRGLVDIFKNETAFRVEIVTFIVFTVIAIFLPIQLIYKAVLILSLPLVLVAEIINSAIERAVDTATLEYDENAKKAKDAASTIVLASLFWVSAIWLITIYIALNR